MIAMVARVLHQPIDEVEEWEVGKFLTYFDHAETIMREEAGGQDGDASK